MAGGARTQRSAATHLTPLCNHHSQVKASVYGYAGDLNDDKVRRRWGGGEGAMHACMPRPFDRLQRSVVSSLPLATRHFKSHTLPPRPSTAWQQITPQEMADIVQEAAQRLDGAEKESRASLLRSKCACCLGGGAEGVGWGALLLSCSHRPSFCY